LVFQSHDNALIDRAIIGIVNQVIHQEIIIISYDQDATYKK